MNILIFNQEMVDLYDLKGNQSCALAAPGRLRQPASIFRRQEKHAESPGRVILFLRFKARFRRRSTHVPNLIELGSTLERHWRDN